MDEISQFEAAKAELKELCIRVNDGNKRAKQAQSQSLRLRDPDTLVKAALRFEDPELFEIALNIAGN